MIAKFEKKFSNSLYSLSSQPLISNKLQFDQYSSFAILLKKVLPKIRKRIRNLKKKAFYLFVELVETNPLMYKIEDLR